MRHCKVLPLEGFTGELSYELPESLNAGIGFKVIVPLGGRIVQGLISAIDEEPPDIELKQIISVSTSYPLFDDEVLETSLTADILAFCETGFHLSNFLYQPPSPKIVKIIRHTNKVTSLSPSEEFLSNRILSSGGFEKLTTLNKNIGKKKVTYALRRLISKGVLIIEEEIHAPKVSFETRWKLASTPEDEQEKRIAEIAHLATSKKELSILSGATSYKINKLASEGKLISVRKISEKAPANLKPPGFSITHVCGKNPDERITDYIQIANELLSQGRSMVIICPSISACKNLAEKMQEEVSKVHLCIGGLGVREASNLSELLKAKANFVAVGMQSALLFPLPNLSKIIVDEPLSPYMDVSKPHTLHLASLAKIRAKISNCPLLFSGSTVSMESMKDDMNSESGSIDIEIVNMTFEPSAFEQPLLSAAMATAIRQEAEQGRSVLVYLNRNGFSSFIVCSECNEVLKCPKCNIPLTFTLHDHNVRCRYCGYTSRAPDICPACGGVSIRFKAGGTERLFYELKKHIQGADILRADGDTKESAHNIRTFKRGGNQVLVGTSMVLDRVDFSKVGLVCIASVDGLLSMPVFSASHKAYSVISTIRSRFKNRLMLQTYLPLHPLIKALATDTLDEFLDGEIISRQEAKYPPYSKILFWHVTSKSEEKARQDAIEVSTKLMNILGEEGVSHPNKGYFHRLKGEFRWDIMTKTEDLDDHLGSLRRVFHEVREGGIRVEITNPNI